MSSVQQEAGSLVVNERGILWFDSQPRINSRLKYKDIMSACD